MRFPALAVAFILAVVSAAAILLVAEFHMISWGIWPQIIAFLSLIVLASYLHAQDPAGGVVSSTGTLFYIAIYIFEPVTAFFVVGVGYAIGNTLPRSWVTWRTFFNGAQMGLSAFLGALVFKGLGGDVASSSLASQITPAVMGPVMHQVANNFFIGFLISQMRGLPFLRIWGNFVREFLWSNLLSIPTAVLISLLYIRVHHAFIAVFLLFLPFQRWAMKLYLEERNSYTRIIGSLVRAGELSLPGTRGHARRVADLAVAVGRKLGLVERDVEALEYAALLHDVGMIGLDDTLGVRESSETEKLIDVHTRVGAEIVAELPRQEIAEMVLDHHTPLMSSSLGGSRVRKLSLGARIIALAEEVDSQLHGLFPHSEAHSPRAVLEDVKRRSGTVFDPAVVEAFLDIHEEVLSEPGLSTRTTDVSLGDTQGDES